MLGSAEPGTFKVVSEGRFEKLLAHPALRELAACLAGTPAWLVGGAVRDRLLGSEDAVDLDVAIDGPFEEPLRCLGAPARSHQRFSTASVELAGARLDLARTRRERYPVPGALPEVEPAPIAEDLDRRDFSVNAIALPLDGGELVDPHGGVEDLRAGRLRLLHRGSIDDDPTRALRGARYAARLGLEPEPETAAQIAAAELTLLSVQRVEAELVLAATEPDPAAVARLLDRWGVIELPRSRIELIVDVDRRLSEQPWAERVGRAEVLVPLLAGRALSFGATELLRLRPDRPGDVYAAGERATPSDLLLARASGASWVDDWVELADLSLSIGGDDLIAAGIDPGPAIGIGLRAALEGRLEGSIEATREAELAAAVAAARGV